MDSFNENNQSFVHLLFLMMEKIIITTEMM